MNKKRIKDPIYGTVIWCVWNCNNEEFGNWIKKRYKHDIPQKLFSGYTLEVGDGYCSEFIIYYQTAEWTFDFIGTLHHELVHLTQYIMEYVGIEFNRETTEAYAYFSSYLLKQIVLAIFKQDIYE